MSRARSVSQLVGANTALGNTVITGTANVSSTLAVGNTSVSGTVSLTYSNATSYTTSTRVGSGLSIYNSSNTNSYAGIELLTEPTSGNAGICGIAGVSTGSGDSALVFGTRGSSTYGERLRIDASGRILMSSQPYALVGLSSSWGSNTLTSDSNLVLDVASQRGSSFNTSNGRWTAPVAGLYHCFLSLLLNPGTDNANRLVFRKNGSDWVPLGGDAMQPAMRVTGTGYQATITLTTIIYLSAGDYVNFAARNGTNVGPIYYGHSWGFFYLIG